MGKGARAPRFTGSEAGFAALFGWGGGFLETVGGGGGGGAVERAGGRTLFPRGRPRAFARTPGRRARPPGGDVARRHGVDRLRAAEAGVGEVADPDFLGA